MIRRVNPTDDGIAVVGLGCRFPDANSPEELWELVLAGRRAFRPIPPERLRIEDYAGDGPDSTYVTHAAVIDGFEFDRVGHKIVGSTYRAADMAHWLALDTAGRALHDAGFPTGEGLSRERVAVVVGNTLTGEFSRAENLRLRFPYVLRSVEAVLESEGRSRDERRSFLEKLEAIYKAPFQTPGEESLAGGLANTIAGRICNHFDFGSGGYTVDGACSSSLLAVSNACATLRSHDADVVLAGGVDLSLDPFELVGFARTGALATELMRVYDENPTGFWPGEGCGFAILMRESDALARGLRVYSVVRGWGISSDGHGGISRPTSEGERRAIDRAYARAGFGVETVPYFEGHGTGTAVGDAIELETLNRARRDGGATTTARLGSIKANFGHTKAAAGIAAFVKASLAVHHQVLPPTVGCRRPHAELTSDDTTLDVAPDGRPWPEDGALRAGVTSMGFGGINVHVVMDGEDERRVRGLDRRTRRLLASAQDRELIVLAADDRSGLREQIDKLRAVASRLSLAELTDLAVECARRVDPDARVRAAVVVSDGAELGRSLEAVEAAIDRGEASSSDPARGVFFDVTGQRARVGYLFPGQGAPAALGGGAFARRYPDVENHFASPRAADGTATEIAQPAIVGASLAGVETLERAGVDAVAACGHSLGELSALAWAGVFATDDVIRLAEQRGRAMANCGHDADARGGMVALGLDADAAERLIAETGATIAGDNGPSRTVVSGSQGAIAAVMQRAREASVGATELRVSHGFHSACVAEARGPFAEQLARFERRPITRRIASTVTGDWLDRTTDVPALLDAQVVEPVRFREALARAADEVDLWIEVGPGTTLTGLATSQLEAPVIAAEVGGDTLAPWLNALGALFVVGAASRIDEVLADRFARPFSLDHEWRFFANPCEQVPTADDIRDELNARSVAATSDPVGSPEASNSRDHDPLTVLKGLVAAKTELPVASIEDHSHFLDDLHLNSIAVGSIIAEACERLGLPVPIAPNEFAGATVAESAEVLGQMTPQHAASSTTGGPVEVRFPDGVERWTRCFTVVDRPEPTPTETLAAGPGELPGPWRRFGRAAVATDLVTELRTALEEGFSSGVVIVDDATATRENIADALEACRTIVDPAAFETPVDQRRAVLLSVGAVESDGAAPLVRTLQQEHPRLRTTIIHVQALDSDTITAALNEVAATTRFREVRRTSAGWVTPHLQPLESTQNERPGSALDVGARDRWLVTGGGKGIAAECALALGRATGCSFVLLGRSTPDDDAVLAENLARFAAEGIDVEYRTADVTDPDAVACAIDGLNETGAITGFLHGAGLNEPRTVRELTADHVERTADPKVDGFAHVLDALDPSRLRHLITFGSIIGRTGLEGEGDYALANAWLREATESFARDHARCHCRCLEWSVWSGVGMGERLGRIEALHRDGIDAITPEQGVAVFLDLLSQAAADQPVAVVISGRLGARATLDFAPIELPILRFLERPRVFVPGVELVVDSELSVASDPYLADHVLRGEMIVPGVIGMEAMTQVASVFHAARGPIALEDIQFLRPIVAAPTAPTTVRVAAIRDGDRVRLAVRSSATQFAVDHFTAVAVLANDSDLVASFEDAAPPTASLHDAELVFAADDLYDDLLFQSGRFRRLRGYRELAARHCWAELTSSVSTDWFRGYHGTQLLTGDPGARDAALHAIQACVPDGVLLPTSVAQWRRREGTPVFAKARELSRDGDVYTYALTLHDAEGQVTESWDRLQLVRVEGTQRAAPWVPELLAPQLERHVADRAAALDLRVAVQGGEGASDRESRRNRAFARLASGHGPSDTARTDTSRNGSSTSSVHRRPDGKPVAVDRHYSASHSEALTLAVSCSRAVACDLERVEVRSEREWSRLLGDRWSLVSAIDGGSDASAVRVWSAMECLKKAGLPVDSPLVVDRVEDAWVWFRSGEVDIATWAVDVQEATGEPHAVIAAVLVHPASVDRPSESVPHANL